ncbi:MAG: hypothetical protein Q9204_001290, partial [Flavoplaca sp. TL-2023a]
MTRHPDETHSPLNIALLPDLNVPDSQFIAGKDAYKHEVYKMHCLFASQINKLDLALESSKMPPQHTGACLQAVDKMETLARLCLVWEATI